jgi:hypothetical protein
VLSGPIPDRGSAALLAFFAMVSGPESQTRYWVAGILSSGASKG